MPFSKSKPEVRDISLSVLNSLENSWPVYSSLLVDSRERAFMTVEAITESVFWLTDMGFIIYEALIRDGLVVELRDAALTARGREFLAGFGSRYGVKDAMDRAA
jgi:hypothetical protein